MTEQKWKEIEQQLLNVKPDDKIDPSLFFGSVTNSGVSVSLPLGLDLRFSRGISFKIDRSADGYLTIELIPNWYSKNRPGSVVEAQPHPYRTAQAAFHHVEVGASLRMIPTTGKMPAMKAWLQRSGNILLTFNYKVEKRSYATSPS